MDTLGLCEASVGVSERETATPKKQRLPDQRSEAGKFDPARKTIYIDILSTSRTIATDFITFTFILTSIAERNMHFFSSSSKADQVIRYNSQQHRDLINERGYPVYLLFIDLGSSVGGGFAPRTAQALKTLAKQWGTAGTAMQHWAVMVDGHVYELARKPPGTVMADEGMYNNPGFSLPFANPYKAWQSARQASTITWRQYGFTWKTRAQITVSGMNLPLYRMRAFC